MVDKIENVGKLTITYDHDTGGYTLKFDNLPTDVLTELLQDAIEQIESGNFSSPSDAATVQMYWPIK